MRGRAFLHPRLGFTFVAPPNFSIDNTPQAILGIDGQGKALRLDTVTLRPGQSLVAYLRSGWIEAVETGSVSSLTLNGNEAATAVARGPEWSFRLYAVRFGSNVYRLIFAARELSDNTDAVFREAAESFRALSQTEARSVRPQRIDVTTVRAGDTPASLAIRMPAGEGQLDRFLILNGMAPDAILQAGERVKIISG
jgi:predicted Zn-dependent protease